MKKVIFFIYFCFIILGLSSCVYSPHYVINYISDKKIYSKSLNGKIFDSDFYEYTIDDNIYVLKPEVTTCYSKTKKESVIRFFFSVYSDDPNFKYKVEDIDFILDEKKHNISEYKINYFPCETELYTPFEKNYVISDYYMSNYHLGFVTFPTPRNKKVEIIVTVSDDNSNHHSFVYKYSIKNTFEIFMSSV